MGYLPYQLVQDFFHQQYCETLSQHGVFVPIFPRTVFFSPKFLSCNFSCSVRSQRRFQPPEAKEALHPSNTEEPPSASGVRVGEAKVRKLSPHKKKLSLRVGFVSHQKMKVFYEKKICLKARNYQSNPENRGQQPKVL